MDSVAGRSGGESQSLPAEVARAGPGAEATAVRVLQVRDEDYMTLVILIGIAYLSMLGALALLLKATDNGRG